MPSPDFSNPLIIVATGAAVCAALWGVALIIPAIAEALGILITAAGAAGGLAVAVGTTGFATAGVVSAWIPPVAAAGLAAAGISTTYLVVAKIVEQGKERPYEWLLPALGLLAVFFVDLTKDQLLLTVTQRALYGLTTGMLTVGGGILLLQRRMVIRCIGLLLPFVPSVGICLLFLRKEHIRAAFMDFMTAGSMGSVGMIGVFMLGLVVAVLGLAIPRKK